MARPGKGGEEEGGTGKKKGRRRIEEEEEEEEGEGVVRKVTKGRTQKAGRDSESR